jgi:hypothetical protein
VITSHLVNSIMGAYTLHPNLIDRGDGCLVAAPLAFERYIWKHPEFHCLRIDMSRARRSVEIVSSYTKEYVCSTGKSSEMKTATIKFAMVQATRLLILPDSGTGHDVGGGVIPLVEVDAGVVRGVNAWDLEERGRSSGTAALNFELVAFDVELGLALMSLMKTDVFDANKVLPSRDLGRDSVLHAILLPCAPSRISTWAVAAQARGHDCEPIARAVIVLHRRPLRCLGEHNESWSRVLDEFIVEELESELVTSLDCVCAGVASLGALVASEVAVVEDFAREGRVIGVGVPTSICVLSANRLTIDNETVEDIVCLSKRRHEHGGESECLEHHSGGLR